MLGPSLAATHTLTFLGVFEKLAPIPPRYAGSSPTMPHVPLILLDSLLWLVLTPD